MGNSLQKTSMSVVKPRSFALNHSNEMSFAANKSTKQARTAGNSAKRRCREYDGPKQSVFQMLR